MGTPRAYAGIAGDERRAQRRARLIEAATDLLADGGAAALTVTGVCTQSGLTARYFYEHFANREALLTAIVDAECDLIIGVARAATVSATGTPAERGAAGVRALLDALEDDPRAVRVARTRAGDDEVVLRLRAEITERLTQAFVSDAELMWPNLDAHPERIELAASLTIGGVMALIVSRLDGNSTMSRDELVQIAARFTVETGRIVLAS